MSSVAATDNINDGSPPKRQRREFRRGGGRGGRGRGGRNGNSTRNRRRRNNNSNDNRMETEDDNNNGVTENTSEEDKAQQIPDSNMQDKCTQDTTSRHQFSTTLFTDCSAISPPSIRALTEVLNYSHMTKVQEATLPSILENHDVVAKAKTGSGKTTAFLLPILEKFMTTKADEYITAVVLSPTRELTQQIAQEFQKLSTFHSGKNKVHLCMIGGTNIDKDKRSLKEKSQLRLLLATPGRLQDHLKQNTANIVQRISRVQILCLDEADRLLDMGFRDELTKILSFMPRDHEAGGRQTLLFSATFPESLKSMTDLALKAQHKFIDTMDEDESHANVQVLQESVVVPLEHHLLVMQQIIQQHINEQKARGQSYKIIVFFTTARIAGFMAELFLARYPQLYSSKNLWEIHSRKSQSHRVKVAKNFTDGSNCLLFSSDVSARGVDYPNVTFVLQVGAPSEKAQYIHRLGRTARAGQAGKGVLLLCEFERVFLNEVKDLDITALEMPAIQEEQVQEEQNAMQQMLQANEKLEASAGAAYQAFLGYYNSNIKRLRLQNKHELVKIANEYATIIGFPEDKPPGLLAKTIGKMGLKGVPGIRIDREGAAAAAAAGRGGAGGQGGRGRGRGGGNGGRGK